VSADGIQAVILLQPTHHLGRGVLERLVERAGVPDGEDVARILAARPADALVLEHMRP
jgi:hypothetical protein